MWEYTFVTTTEIPIDQLWSAVMNTSLFSDGFGGTDTMQRDGVRQSVRIRGRDYECRMTVKEIDPPCRLVLVKSIFLATIRSQCEFHTTPSGTQIDVAVQLNGPLGWFYRSSLAARLNQELPSRVRELVVKARIGNPSSQGYYDTLSVVPAAGNGNASTINR